MIVIQSEIKGLHMKTIRGSILPGMKFVCVSEGEHQKYGPTVAIKSDEGHLGRVPIELATVFRKLLAKEKVSIMW